MSQAAVKIAITNAQRPEQEVVALEDWLRRARLQDVSMRRDRQSIRPGDMGAELLPILTAVLSSTGIAELVKVVHGWLTSRRRPLEVELEIDGRKVRLQSEGGEPLAELVAHAERLVQGKTT